MFSSFKKGRDEDNEYIIFIKKSCYKKSVLFALKNKNALGKHTSFEWKIFICMNICLNKNKMNKKERCFVLKVKKA